jgi:hypothetical protein
LLFLEREYFRDESWWTFPARFDGLGEGNHRRLYSEDIMEPGYSVRKGCGVKEVETDQGTNTGPKPLARGTLELGPDIMKLNLRDFIIFAHHLVTLFLLNFLDSEIGVELAKCS